MQKPWRRKRDGAILAGVCNGLADSLDASPDLVRFITVLLFFVSSGTILLVYLVLAIALPLNTDTSTTFDKTKQNDTPKMMPKAEDDEYAFDPNDYKL